MKKIQIITALLVLMFSACGDVPKDMSAELSGKFKQYSEEIESAECGEMFVGSQTVDIGDCPEGKYCENNRCKDACEDMNCGMDHGVECGTCFGDQICDKNICRKACEDMNCGTDHGVECGTCDTDWLCGSDNVCYDPCSGIECGESEGVQCGQCSGNEYCESNQCKTPCENMNCGTDHGFDCGTCENGYKCEDNSCIVDHCPYENFPNHNDGDCWSDKAPNTMTHANAISYCEGLGGHLPTISKLRTLIKNCPATQTGGSCGVTDSCLSWNDCRDSSCAGCSSDSSGKYSVFGDTGWFWSSSVQSDGTGTAWNVYFSGGDVHYGNWASYIYVRCVH